jgi:hypothetical protein
MGFARGAREKVAASKDLGTAKLLERKRGRRPGGFVMEAQINELCPKRDIPGYESLFGG